MVHSNVVSNKELAEHLHIGRHAIYDEWLDRLRGQWGGKAETKLAYIQANRRIRADLFAILLESFKQDIEFIDQNIKPLYKKIRSLDYSISDYYEEVSCLERCLDRYLRSLADWSESRLLDGIIAVHSRLNEITMRVLKECSEFFEHIAETSKTAFCQTDEQGRIVFANREMNRLTEESAIIGNKLSQYFMNDDEKIISNTILDRENPRPTILRLNLISANGKRTPVGSEIGTVVINGRYKGGYAHFTDISLADQQNNQLFDRALLGIVKLNCKGDILFANKSMLQILNRNDYQGVSVYDLLPDNEAKYTVKDYLVSRREGKSDEYPLDLVRFGDNTKIPVMVSAFPETDLRGNKVIGSFAIVRCRVADRMHQHIESHHDETTLLENVSKELSLIVRYDCITVSKYSYDLRYACPIFSNDGVSGHSWLRRWWKMTPAQIKWANQKEVLLVEDLEKFLDQKEWKALRSEPDIQNLLAGGYKSFIFYPIFRNQRLVAAVSLLNKSRRTLKEQDKQQLRNLPIESAVHMALYYYNRRESSFTSDLISNLANAGNNIKSIASVIVESVAAHYKWNSVSLYKVKSKKEVIQLIEQNPAKSKYQIAKDFEQEIGKGVLGHVSLHEKVVNIGHVDEDEQFKDIYVNAVETVHMKSELCIPIKFSGAFWLLNIEDEQIDAFSEEEQKEICRVMDSVREYLESNWLNRFLEASMKSATDAVLLTDIEGRILQVNPAAIRLLAIPLSQENHVSAVSEDTESIRSLQRITPSPLKSLFVDPSEADHKMASSYKTATVIKLKRRNGGTVPVMMTGVNLQEDFGYTIHIAADMTAQQRLKQIENLEKIYHEIAIQTKTPISLIAGWVRRVKKYATGKVLKDSVDKILRQLKKLEITYDRLALYSAEKEALPFNRTLLDISEVIEAIKNELPISELELIDWQYDKDKSYLLGDMFQLKFCFETILSHLLRFVPQDDVISVSIRSVGTKIMVKIGGWHPQHFKMSTETTDQKDDVARAISDMALGERLVGQFITKHEGTYIPPVQTDDKVTFSFELPRVEGR